MNASTPATHATVTEPSREIKIFGEFDVCVIGGGPAGLAAAASAARSGAKTLLVERYGFLGGMGTAGGVTNFAGLYGKRDGRFEPVVQGVARDLLDRIDAMGGLNEPQGGMSGRIQVRSYDTSALKCAADDMLADAGAHILFHALAAGVLMMGKRIHALVLETKSGRRAVLAQSFIDCSGDADVAAFAGVPYELGDGAGSGLFPTTMFRVGHVEPKAALKAIGKMTDITPYMEAAASKYEFARDGAIVRPQKNTSEWRANVTQIANAQGRAMDATDAVQLSAGETNGRRQVREYMRFLRAEVPGFAASSVIEIAPQVGIRESRRVQGVYALTGADIENSAQFSDSIGINAWPMELHNAGRIDWIFPKLGTRTGPGGLHRAYNDLPWRMLVPVGVANLLVAGRCASMTHEGQSAARASGACFAMGQAAGTAAAHFSTDFAQHNVQQLQQQLLTDGAYIELGNA